MYIIFICTLTILWHDIQYNLLFHSIFNGLEFTIETTLEIFDKYIENKEKSLLNSMLTLDPILTLFFICDIIVCQFITKQSITLLMWMCCQFEFNIFYLSQSKGCLLFNNDYVNIYYGIYWSTNSISESLLIPRLKEF